MDEIYEKKRNAVKKDTQNCNKWQKSNITETQQLIKIQIKLAATRTAAELVTIEKLLLFEFKLSAPRLKSFAAQLDDALQDANQHKQKF